MSKTIWKIEKNFWGETIIRPVKGTGGGEIILVAIVLFLVFVLFGVAVILSPLIIALLGLALQSAFRYLSSIGVFLSLGYLYYDMQKNGLRHFMYLDIRIPPANFMKAFLVMNMYP